MENQVIIQNCRPMVVEEVYKSKKKKGLCKRVDLIEGKINPITIIRQHTISKVLRRSTSFFTLLNTLEAFAAFPANPSINSWSSAQIVRERIRHCFQTERERVPEEVCRVLCCCINCKAERFSEQDTT